MVVGALAHVIFIGKGGKGRILIRIEEQVQRNIHAPGLLFPGFTFRTAADVGEIRDPVAQLIPCVRLDPKPDQ